MYTVLELKYYSSINTKKKELIGDFKNSGSEWCVNGQPVEVRMHDFADPKSCIGKNYQVHCYREMV